MKILKKMLSGAMALTMAASMMLTTAVQAGATTKSDGSHELTMKAGVESLFGFLPYNAFVIEGFDSKEVKLLEKADKKGYAIATLSFYKDENNYIQVLARYDDGCWGPNGIKENGTVLKVGCMTDTSKSAADKKVTIFTELDNTTFNKYKNSQYRYWSIVAYDDKNNVVDEYSFGTNVPAKDSKILEGLETEEAPSETAKENDISTLEISKVKNMTYTGKNRKPAVTIKDGDKTLVKGTDYTVSYKNCKNIGTATVTIKGKGDYTGSKTIEYKIVPKKTALKVSKKSDTKAKFTWTAVDGAEKYQIYYSKDGGKTYKLYKTVSGEKTSYTTSKLDFEKYDYKFKIRSYGTNDGKKYYSSYSKAVTVK